MRIRDAIHRHLLQRDRSYPERTEEEYLQEVDRNYRWNFTFNTSNVSAYFLGASLISGWTIVPLFISKLTTSPVPIGIAAILVQGSWYLPQILTANFIQRSPAMKPLLVNLGFFLERLPLGVILTSAFLAKQSPTLALVLFLLGYAWYGLGSGMMGPAWQDMVARCFPVDKRGRFLGFSSALGTLTGVAGSALSIWLLASYSFPTNFILLFLCAILALLTSWVSLFFVREPIPPVHTFHQTGKEFLSSLSGILREKRNFRRFLVARLMIGLGTMGVGFLTLSAIQKWGVSDSLVGTFTTMQLIGQGVGMLLLGLLADRKGHKLSLVLSAMAAGLGYLIAWFAPSAEYYLATFALLGFANGGNIVSGILIVLEFAEPERRPSYIGIASTGLGFISMVAPIFGTWFATLSYPWLFGISGCINLLAAMAMHFWVKEPRFSTASSE
jgi:MFS family permease